MESNHKLLREVIRRRNFGCVQVRTSTDARQLQVRLLEEGTVGGEHGIWVQLVQADRALVERLTAARSPVLVYVDHEQVRITFDSALLRTHRPLFGGERVLLAWPPSLSIKERRGSPREHPDDPNKVNAVLVRGGGRAYEGPGLPLQVWDVSAGGACFICPPAAPVRLKPRENVEIRFRMDGSEHRINARLCHTDTLPGGHLRFGVEFDRQSLQQETADQLSALLEELQHRRMRRSLDNALVRGTW